MAEVPALPSRAEVPALPARATVLESREGRRARQRCNARDVVHGRGVTRGLLCTVEVEREGRRAQYRWNARAVVHGKGGTVFWKLSDEHCRYGELAVPREVKCFNMPGIVFLPAC